MSTLGQTTWSFQPHCQKPCPYSAIKTCIKSTDIPFTLVSDIFSNMPNSALMSRTNMTSYDMTTMSTHDYADELSSDVEL